MGIDKLITFLNHNLNNIIDEINITANVRKILVNHIFIDISFVIYQSLVEIEQDINNIIKIILSYPYILSYTSIQDKIIDIYNLPYWKNNIESITNILVGNTEEEIITNFLKYIIQENKLENIIIDNIYNKIINWIDNIHILTYLQSINIIFDGIPSYSKILEQRRRRIKHYIESKMRKKKFDEYYKDFKNTYYDHNNLNYNFYKWLKYRFSIDKSFGPISLLITKLEDVLYTKLSINFPNILIYIDSGSNNGEADYKIFHNIYIKQYLGDIIIHTVDSDLIHQIIVQQNYFNLIHKDIFLSVIKYNNKDNNYVQFIDGYNLNKNLLIYYNKSNNIIDSSLNIIYDLALIFLFFGNDYFPISTDIGPELTLEYYCKIHFLILNNNHIIKLDNNNKILFNFNNFKLYLTEINKNKESNKSKIILCRYFKLNYTLITYLTDKLQLTIKEIILLCKKLLLDDSQNIINLDEEDLRYKLKNKYKSLNYPFNSDLINKIEFKMHMNTLLSSLDILDDENNYCGLPIISKQFYLLDDNYENLYLHFNEKIINDLLPIYPIIYDYIPLESIYNNHTFIDLECSNIEIDSFLKKIYHLVITLFGNMQYYNSNNFTYYTGYSSPSYNSIINFLNNISIDLENKYINEISHETMNANTYFNSINHHLIITPYIKEILYKFTLYDINYYINKLNLYNLWWSSDTDIKYKDINIDEFFKLWNAI